MEIIIIGIIIIFIVSYRTKQGESVYKFISEQAINTYKAHQENKNFLPPFIKPTPNYEQDFYFDLRWNFNNYAQTQYYIAQ